MSKINGKKPLEEDSFYLEWIKESYKENIKNVNDILKNFIVVIFSLASLLFGFFDEIVIDTNYKKLILALLILGMLTSMIGVFPWVKLVQYNNPKDIDNYKKNRMIFKYISLGLTFLIILVILLILIYIVS